MQTFEMGWLWTLWILLYVSTAYSNVIGRQNFGVKFQDVGILDASTPEFHVTFALPHISVNKDGKISDLCLHPLVL
jgi:hypothetical protein